MFIWLRINHILVYFQIWQKRGWYCSRCRVQVNFSFVFVSSMITCHKVFCKLLVFFNNQLKIEVNRLVASKPVDFYFDIYFQNNPRKTASYLDILCLCLSLRCWWSSHVIINLIWAIFMSKKKVFLFGSRKKESEYICIMHQLNNFSRVFKEKKIVICCNIWVLGT